MPQRQKPTILRAKESTRSLEERLSSALDDLRTLHEEVSRNTQRTEAAVDHMVKEMHKLTRKYETLQTSIVKTLTFLFELLSDPDAKAHAAAVVKDFQINKGSTYKPQ